MNVYCRSLDRFKSSVETATSGRLQSEQRNIEETVALYRSALTGWQAFRKFQSRQVDACVRGEIRRTLKRNAEGVPTSPVSVLRLDESTPTRMRTRYQATLWTSVGPVYIYIDVVMLRLWRAVAALVAVTRDAPLEEDLLARLVMLVGRHLRAQFPSS
jgi:hypothetical protein